MPKSKIQISLISQKLQEVDQNLSKQSFSKESFTKDERLRSSRDFVPFFKNSTLKKFPEFSIYRIPSEKKTARLGITIKTSKVNSVRRNRLKRLIREFFRKKLKALGAYDYNFVIHKDQVIDDLFLKKISLRFKNDSFTF